MAYLAPGKQSADGKSFIEIKLKQKDFLNSRQTSGLVATSHISKKDKDKQLEEIERKKFWNIVYSKC